LTPGAEYLKSRGVDPVFADACRVRYHPSWLGRGEAVVFAGFDRAGHLVAAQGRFLSPTADPKTMSKGKIALAAFSTPNALVTHRRAEAGPVAIVEAPIDAIALAQVGLPAVALFGAYNRPAWLRRALAYRDCVIATDDDEAGNQAAESLRAWLDLSPRKVRLFFGGAKDASELLERSPERLALLVEEAIKAASPLHRAVTTTLEALSDLDCMLAVADEAETETCLGSSAPVEGDPPPPVTESDDGLSLLDYAGKVLGWHEDWPEARPSNWDELAPFGEYVEPEPVLDIPVGGFRSLGSRDGRWPGYGYCSGSMCRMRIEARTEDEARSLFREHLEGGHTPLPINATAVPAYMLDPAHIGWRLAEKKKKNKEVDVCGGCGSSFSAPTKQESAALLRAHIENDPCAHYANPSALELAMRKPLREPGDAPQTSNEVNYRGRADSGDFDLWAARIDAE
jgi:hypothetical protein